jgi:hypothetical protein
MAAHLAFGAASSAVVGMAAANGEFTVDDARMPGAATLFEGSRIQTGRAPSRIRLHNGARVQLGSGASGVIYGDRMVLERGSTEMEGFAGYSLEALSLRVRGTGPAGVRVTVGEDQVVQVAALRGPVRVYKSSGLLVANVAAGSALAFTPQTSGAVAVSRISGCLEKDANKFFIGDETTQVRFEVRGVDLAAHVGKRVEVVGIAEPEGEGAAPISVTSVRALPGKCALRAAAVAGGAGAAAAKGASQTGTAAGAGTAASTAGAAAAGGIATKAVIAGVLVAGGVAGAAVAATRDERDAISPTTR